MDSFQQEEEIMMASFGFVVSENTEMESEPIDIIVSRDDDDDELTKAEQTATLHESADVSPVNLCVKNITYVPKCDFVVSENTDMEPETIELIVSRGDDDDELTKAEQNATLHESADVSPVNLCVKDLTYVPKCDFVVSENTDMEPETIEIIVSRDDDDDVLTDVQQNNELTEVQQNNELTEVQQNNDATLHESAEVSPVNLCVKDVTFVPKCDICSSIFTRKADLERHLLIHSKKTQKHTCTICEKSFLSKYNFKTHVKIHGNREPEICQLCGKQFLSSNGLKLHQKTHEGKRKFLCSFCGNSFNFKHDLNGHQTVHTGNKLHKCVKCEKSYTYKNYFNQHVKVCGEESAFKCNYCSGMFKQKRYLKDHMDAHQNTEKYQCTDCGHFFKHRGSLYKHCKATGLHKK